MFLSIMLFVATVFAEGELPKHENELVVLSGKVFVAEKNIKEKIAEKNLTTDKVKLQEILAEIKKNLNDRAEGIRRYNKEYHHVKYEHPEKGKAFDRKYKHYDEKAAKDFEDEINKLLSDVLKDVKNKYESSK